MPLSRKAGLEKRGEVSKGYTDENRYEDDKGPVQARSRRTRCRKGEALGGIAVPSDPVDPLQVPVRSARPHIFCSSPRISILNPEDNQS